MLDSIKEYCGIFGVFKIPQAAYWTSLGLFALQHRGEESAGIVTHHAGMLHGKHGLGLVSDVFSQEQVDQLQGDSAIGHVRYSTAGGTGIHNCQPFLMRYKQGPIALAHNGNLTNADTLKHILAEQGTVFSSSSDSEAILHFIARAQKDSLIEQLKEALSLVKGAYCLLLLTPWCMIAVRDPHGFRPLVVGRKTTPTGTGYVVASESCALDMIEASYDREIAPGEIVVFSLQGVQSYSLDKAHTQSTPCVFEHIYFSRPDSFVFSRPVYETRKALGRALAQIAPIKADMVIPVPDSGVPAAIGYSEASGISFDMALTRSHYVGRSFIKPEQETRALSVKLKLSTIRSVLDKKRVVIVDDSLVRGTTSRQMIQLLRQAGVKEVHLRISAPPSLYPCFYGIDMPDQAQLIAARMNQEEIRQFIDADSLAYLTIDDVRQAVAYSPGQFCESCFTGCKDHG